MNPILFAWLITSSLFFAWGEFLSKKFAMNPSFKMVLLVLVIDTLATLAWLPALLQKNQLSVVGTMWSVLSLLATTLIGIFLFHEEVSLMTISGIVFAFISISLLSFA